MEVDGEWAPLEGDVHKKLQCKKLINNNTYSLSSSSTRSFIHTVSRPSLADGTVEDSESEPRRWKDSFFESWTNHPFAREDSVSDSESILEGVFGWATEAAGREVGFSGKSWKNSVSESIDIMLGQSVDEECCSVDAMNELLYRIALRQCVLKFAVVEINYQGIYTS